MSRSRPQAKSTISHDPYAFMGGGQKKPAADEEPKRDQAAKTSGAGETEKITTPFPKELIERARDAAYWDRLTLTGIIVQAVSEAIDRMERERGEAYPPRKSALKGGRPIGSGKARNTSNT